MTLSYKIIFKDFSKSKLRKLTKQDIIVEVKLPNSNKTSINKLKDTCFNMVTIIAELSVWNKLNRKGLTLNLFKRKVLEKDINKKSIKQV
jgi:hypothetical protein